MTAKEGLAHVVPFSGLSETNGSGAAGTTHRVLLGIRVLWAMRLALMFRPTCSITTIRMRILF